jgi:hypothetical protein
LIAVIEFGGGNKPEAVVIWTERPQLRTCTGEVYYWFTDVVSGFNGKVCVVVAVKKEQ